MNKEIITDEEIKKIIKFYYDGCDDFDYEREYTRKLEVYINQLQKKAELVEHYKHLYSEVKKQKDEIFKYIKSFEYYIPEDNKNELLRMLGEIE